MLPRAFLGSTQDSWTKSALCLALQPSFLGCIVSKMWQPRYLEKYIYIPGKKYNWKYGDKYLCPLGATISRLKRKEGVDVTTPSHWRHAEHPDTHLLFNRQAGEKWIYKRNTIRYWDKHIFHFVLTLSLLGHIGYSGYTGYKCTEHPVKSTLCWALTGTMIINSNFL